MSLVSLHLRPAKTEEISPAAQEGVLSSFLTIGKHSAWKKLQGIKQPQLALELVSVEQKTKFNLLSPANLAGYFTSQILSQYPQTLIEKSNEITMYEVFSQPYAILTLTQNHPYWYPINTYKNLELSPFAAILGFLAKLEPGEKAGMQMLVRAVNQESIQRQVRKQLKQFTDEGTEKASEYASVIQKKLETPMLEAQVRLIMSASDLATAQARVIEMAGTYGVYTLSEGNSLGYQQLTRFNKNKVIKAMAEYNMVRGKSMYLTTQEAASLWHLPDKSMEKIKLIDWGKQLVSEAPDNLPISEGKSEMDKREINYFGTTEWKNQQNVFGIRRKDRRKHTYIIGKTGAGKSTMIANMAINDIRNGEGVAVIDPHGDLSEMILQYVPKRRVNDVVYLDPTLSDSKNFSLNLFDDLAASHTDVVASGIVSIFYKLYAHSWGPRLEYILRNSILTLLYYGDATFADIPKLLTNDDYRKKVIATVSAKDEIIAAFWKDEFEKMNERLRVEAVSPILNKVGQFLSSQRIRHIVGQKKSTINLDEIMNEQKILIVNLSQGKLGEDTMALLGAMFITKMQLTAMNRVHLPEEERKDFYLYVDEFQNFATHSFIKILSEARKYRLNLTLANQYIGQVDEEIQKAIFGNIGTMISFVVGATDAAILEREYGGLFTAEDMVSLGKFAILLKMTIDDLTSLPFEATSLPLPAIVNNNLDKIIKVNLERYYKSS
jgi:hypothetical protein